MRGVPCKDSVNLQRRQLESVEESMVSASSEGSESLEVEETREEVAAVESYGEEINALFQNKGVLIRKGKEGSCIPPVQSSDIPSNLILIVEACGLLLG